MKKATQKTLKNLILVATLLISTSAIAKGSKKKSVYKKQIVTSSPYGAANLTSKYASWGIDPHNSSSSINLLKAWNNFKKKKDVIVAVVDTGIDPAHPFLSSNLYVSTGRASNSNFGIDFSKNRKYASRPVDTHGHGTHVSGIIRSVFPEVKIFTLKYYNPKANGEANLNSTIQALRHAVDSNVDIINYSGGGPEPALEELRILKRAEKKGILVIAAAGNEQSNIDYKKNAYYPASYGLTNIVTVTAHDQLVRVLPSSNYGKRSVDISAPGYRIKSAFPHNRAGYLTGTSQATAFVSGVAALIKAQYPSLTTEQIKKALIDSAKKEISLKEKCFSGGRLDATKALSYANTTLHPKKKSKKSTKRAIANRRKDKGRIIYRMAK